MSFTSGNDINILQATDTAIVGAGDGNDIYILSESAISENQELTISDSGANTLQLVDGLSITSSQVTNNAVQLTLSNGAVITVLDASDFTFDVGGNATMGITGTVQDFSTFASDTLGTPLPAAGEAPVQGSGTTIGSNDDDPDQIFTLTEIPSQTETTLTWNDMDLEDAIAFFQSIDDLDLEALGVQITEGDFNVESINISDSATGESSTVTVTLDNGEQNEVIVNTPVALYAQIIAGLQDSSTTTQTGIVLTPTENNGGSFESGFTTDDNDLIIAGRPELLHGAYIDGGEGYNTLEVDMKGFFAQPFQLLNIQEVRIQNLTNYYSVDQTIIDDSEVAKNFPIPDGEYLDGDDSVLDLSRASDLESLVITESDAGGDLTVLGIKNGASIHLSGGYENNITLHYSNVYNDQLYIDMHNVTFDEGTNFTVAHNVGALNIHSGGHTNVLNNVDFGEYFQELYVHGWGQLVIEGNLEFAFNEAFIDASENTGGLRVNVSAEDVQGENDLEVVTIMGSQARDVITLDGDVIAEGALLTINTNIGNDTLIIDASIDAGAGSVITGENLTVQVNADADLRLADVSGVEDFVISAEGGLLLNLAQVTEVGIDNFSADHNTIPVLTIELTEDATLSDIIDLNALDSDIRLAFSIESGATLTLSAEELHTYLTENAVAGDGNVVITGAGLEFNENDPRIDTADDDGDGDINNTPPFGDILGDGFGTIDSDSVDGDIHIIRSQDGYERPEADDDTDTLIIDTTGAAPMPIDGLDAPGVETLIIMGDQDAVFTDTVKLAEDFTIDFSDLSGALTGLTIEDFNDVEEVIGNGAEGVRIDVMLSGNVEVEDAAAGLLSSGVKQYVVVDMADADGDPADYEFHLCDNTQDVQVVGLQGNADSTLTFTNVPWGAVNPTILFEGDGKGDWTELSKADGNPNQSNVGTIVAEYFFDGAPANVLITNQGVAPGTTSTGDERAIVVKGIVIDNATSLNVTVEDGNAVITDITDNGSGDGLKDIDLTSAKDVTLHLDNDESEVLDTIDASGVAGDATLVIDTDQNVNLSETVLTDIDAILLQDEAELTLSITQIDDMGVDVISHFDFDDNDDEATLNIAGLGEDAFSLPAGSAEGIVLGTVTIADEDSVVLHADTDLTGATAVIVLEDTVVTMTAEQFMQFATYDLNGNLIAAPDVIGDGTLNITDLTQDIVDAGFSLENVTALEGQITLAEDVVLNDATDLGDASIELATDQTINFATVEQASAREVTVADGATDTTVEYAFTTGDDGDDDTGFDIDGNGAIVGDDETDAIDTSNYSSDLEVLRVKSALLADNNVEQVLAGLDSAITVDIFTPAVGTIEVNGTNRVVVAEAGANVEGSLTFDDLQGNVRVETLELTLQGGVQIAADDANSFYAIDVAEATADIVGFEKLTINSEGESANVLGDDDHMDGDIQATHNDLLNVEINAAQDLTVNGTIFFTKEDDAVDNAAATLTLTGAGDITVAALDTSDANVDTLNIVNNATGTVNVPGASPALTVDADVDGEGDAQTANLVITGTGDDINFGTADDPDTELVDESNSGVSINGPTTINAADFQGALDLGIVTGDVGEDETLTITGSQGITTLTLGATNDNNFSMDATAVVTIDLSASAAGSSVTLTEDAVLPDMTGEAAADAGSLTIKAGTLVIEDNVDFRNLVDEDGTSKLDLSAVTTIELAQGASVQMSDDQWDALTAAQQAAIEGDGQTLVVDQVFIDTYGSDLTEFRGITTIQIEETVTNVLLTMTDNQAAVAITGEFDDGVFTPGTWDDDGDGDGGTAEIDVEAGNFSNLDITTAVQVIIDSDSAQINENLGLTGLIAVDAFDLTMAENTYAALTIMDTQVAALDDGVNDLSANSDLAPFVWADSSDLDQLATDSVVKIEVQIGADIDTAEPIFGTRDVTITIDRTTDTEVVDVTGSAGALGAADAAFVDFLDSAATVEWTGVGSELSANAGNNQVTLDATDAVDTFEYVAAPHVDYADDVEINFFVAGADGDVLDFSAIVGAASLSGTTAVDATTDVDLSGANNIAKFDLDGGDFTVEDVVQAGTAVDGEVIIGDNGEAIVAVADGMASDEVELYYVHDTDATAGFTAAIQLIGTVTLDPGDTAADLLAENFA